jgi:hypothetical protein
MPTSAKTSFTPRETMFDIDYLIILVLEKLGLVWDVKRPSQKMVDKGIMDGVVRPKRYQKGSEEKSDDDDQSEDPPQKMAS